MKNDALIPASLTNKILGEVFPSTLADLKRSVPDGHALALQLIDLGAPAYFFELNRRRDGFVRCFEFSLAIDGIWHAVAYCAGVLAIGSPCSKDASSEAVILGDWRRVELCLDSSEELQTGVSLVSALSSSLPYHLVESAFKEAVGKGRYSLQNDLSQGDLLLAIERHFEYFIKP